MQGLSIDPTPRKSYPQTAIHLARPHRRWVEFGGSWNFSRVCRFYFFFKTIDLLFIFSDGWGKGEGHRIGHFWGCRIYI